MSSIKNLVRFSGGLGDVIISSIKDNRWNNIIEYSKNNKIVIALYTHNKNIPSLFLNTPFSKNIFIYDYLSEGNKWNDVFSLYDEKRILAMTEYENIFLKRNKINCDIDRSFDIFKSEQEKMKHFLTLEDQYYINYILDSNKPFLIVSASASTSDRNIPIHVIDDFYEKFKNEYNIVQIGYDGSNYSDIKYQPEYRIKKESIDLVNKISISGNLYLIDLCQGILASDSSMYCYAAYNNKKIITGIKNKNEEKYGFIDKSKRLHYFDAYNRDSVIVFDFREYKNIMMDDFEKKLRN